MKFTDEYLDPTGLYHLRARQYDPAVGRLLQRDPMSSNLSQRKPLASDYAYVADRPTVLVDPTGMDGTPANVSPAGQDSAQYVASPGGPAASQSDGFTIGDCTYHALRPEAGPKADLRHSLWRKGRGRGQIECSKDSKVSYYICTQRVIAFWVIEEKCLNGDTRVNFDPVRSERILDLAGPRLKTLRPCYIEVFKSRIRDGAKAHSDTSDGVC
jgi:RHS repeat-associated protein